MRILIAEDEPISRLMLEKTLTKWGFEVTVTHDGGAALAALEDPEGPNLAILDVKMPVLSGLEVCRRVRQSTQARPMHIILLTAVSDKDDLVAGFQAGADDYIKKPFDCDELYARVQVGIRVVKLQNNLSNRLRELEDAEAELRSLSLTDDLTGLYNRRGFLIHAEKYLKISHRMGVDFLLFYMDIDGLKQINDTFGHEEGSSAIVRVAKILKETFRESDVITRLGGDEFVVLSMDADRGDADSFKARLDQKFRKANELGTSNYQLSLSVGIVCVDSETTSTLEELIVQADKQMYGNKRKKKSRLVLQNRMGIGDPTPLLETQSKRAFAFREDQRPSEPWVSAVERDI